MKFDVNAPRTTETWLLTSAAPQADALWLALNVLPAIVTVPDRNPPELRSACSVTEPMPEPEAAPATVIQLALDAADQEQPAGANTLTVRLPPLALKIWLIGLMSYVHAPVCETVTVFPAIEIVPSRGVVLGFASTVYG